MLNMCFFLNRSEGRSSRGISSPGGGADQDQVFPCCRRVVSCRRRIKTSKNITKNPKLSEMTQNRSRSLQNPLRRKKKLKIGQKKPENNYRKIRKKCRCFPLKGLRSPLTSMPLKAGLWYWPLAFAVHIVYGWPEIVNKNVCQMAWP